MLLKALIGGVPFKSARNNWWHELPILGATHPRRDGLQMPVGIALIRDLRLAGGLGIFGGLVIMIVVVARFLEIQCAGSIRDRDEQEASSASAITAVAAGIDCRVLDIQFGQISSRGLKPLLVLHMVQVRTVCAVWIKSKEL